MYIHMMYIHDIYMYIIYIYIGTVYIIYPQNIPTYPTKYQRPNFAHWELSSCENLPWPNRAFPAPTMATAMFEVSNAGALPKDGGTTCDHFGCQCLGGKIVLGTPNWMCGRGVTWETLFYVGSFQLHLGKGFENQTSWDWESGILEFCKEIREEFLESSPRSLVKTWFEEVHHENMDLSQQEIAGVLFWYACKSCGPL